MTYKGMGVVDNNIMEKFDRLVAKYHQTADQDALDAVAYGICEEISELRQVVTRLDKKYIEMEKNARLAVNMSQTRGMESKRLQSQVNELMRQNGDLKRRLNNRMKVPR